MPDFRWLNDHGWYCFVPYKPGFLINSKASDLEFIKRKLLNLRIFSDSHGKFNLSVKEVRGEILLVSQFTLFGDCRKGNRPSFSRTASPELAESLYHELKDQLAGSGIEIATGVFAAHMEVSMINDGPVTLLLDSRKEVY